MFTRSGNLNRPENNWSSRLPLQPVPSVQIWPVLTGVGSTLTRLVHVPLTRSVAVVQSLPLAHADKEKILGLNAAQLLKLQ